MYILVLINWQNAAAAQPQNDYYEISPRPFTVAPNANRGFQYAKPPPRPANYQQQSQNVFTPQRYQNVPSAEAYQSAAAEPIQQV